MDVMQKLENIVGSNTYILINIIGAVSIKNIGLFIYNVFS